MVFVIAEIGDQHDGHFPTAIQLIKDAKVAGADAVKFQIGLDTLCAEDHPKFEAYKYLELSRLEFRELASFCVEKKIEFMATPFSLDAVDFLEEIGVKRYKVASSDITYIPLLERIAKTRKPVIISTGMASEKEIAYSLCPFWGGGSLDVPVTLLKCTVEYPCPESGLNLSGIAWLKKRFCFGSVGFSDHSSGVLAPALAVALGATVIEKHLRPFGSCCYWAIGKYDFARMVEDVRRAERMIGVSYLTTSAGEEAGKSSSRRNSISWKREAPYAASEA